MLFSSPSSMAIRRSSLELMLEAIQKMEDHEARDEPPALPVRPATRSRLPSARRSLPILFKMPGTDQENLDSSCTREGFESNGRKKGTLIKDCACGGGETTCRALQKICTLDYERERTLQGVIGIQKCFRGHQARCYYGEIKKGIITLQSFVRGEKTRKDYQVLVQRFTAIIVIQKYTKKQIAWRSLQKEQQAVIYLQSVVRGCLARRNFKCTKAQSIENINLQNQDPMNSKMKDHVRVPHSVLAELQRKVLRVEAALRQKEMENDSLRLKFKPVDYRWSLRETEMKSMETMWQEQLTNLQMSLAAAKKITLPANDTGNHVMPTGKKDRRICANGSVNAMNQCVEQEVQMLYSDPNTGAKPKQLASTTSSDNELLQELNQKFEAWTKDYKTQLRGTKAALQKLSSHRTENSIKKWWRS